MFFFRLLSRLPFWLLYSVADLLYGLGYYVAGYRKKVITTNLARAFPEKSDEVQRQIAKKYYRHLAYIIVETFKLLTIRESDLRRRVRIRNPELCLRYLQSGQTVIVMTTHQGNWEWLLQSNALQLGFDVDAVYRPLRNPFFERLMLLIRSRFGPYPVAMQALPRELVKRKEITRIIAMVADQSPAPESAYWTTFLNQDTPFYTGAAKIAQRTGFPVLFTRMYRLKRGYYETEFVLIAEPPYNRNEPDQIIESYARLAEQSIRQYPSQWLWSHKRWKHSRPQTGELKPTT